MLENLTSMDNRRPQLFTAYRRRHDATCDETIARNPPKVVIMNMRLTASFSFKVSPLRGNQSAVTWIQLKFFSVRRFFTRFLHGVQRMMHKCRKLFHLQRNCIPNLVVKKIDFTLVHTRTCLANFRVFGAAAGNRGTSGLWSQLLDRPNEPGQVLFITLSFCTACTSFVVKFSLCAYFSKVIPPQSPLPTLGLIWVPPLSCTSKKVSLSDLALRQTTDLR